LGISVFSYITVSSHHGLIRVLRASFSAATLDLWFLFPFAGKSLRPSDNVNLPGLNQEKSQNILPHTQASFIKARQALGRFCQRLLTWLLC